jgi:hypothetical protein
MWQNKTLKVSGDMYHGVPLPAERELGCWVRDAPLDLIPVLLDDITTGVEALVAKRPQAIGSWLCQQNSDPKVGKKLKQSTILLGEILNYVQF